MRRLPSWLFLGLQQVESLLIEMISEYNIKSRPIVDFSEIYSKPFENPCKHWKLLTKKLTQFDEKTKSNPRKSNIQKAEQRKGQVVIPKVSISPIILPLDVPI
ncbi:hypothetical protein E7Z59_13055 [Robertkochia marina]|uniref:Uncharacterized protein n=1 Tax=Robertkochia marina TaxID=1227945 RepID=A0A4S3LZ44_9FLAO|nr:hypothetical protein [Robertkochia marina]THD66706.1 hypothetical protein E7Z59_13055 [Robertkochia marina]TRZ45455.1 hypothetical protein D3A96_05570 [Robertkochia marina]